VKKKLLWPVLLILVFVLSRWPGLMPPGFTAAYAILFCAGLYLPGRWGWFIPLCVLGGSDFLLNAFYSHGSFSAGKFILAELPVFLAYAGLIALGRAFEGKRPFWMLVGGGLLGAIVFYIVTNTAAWLSDPGYPKSLAGWIQAITVGLPGYPQTWEFFRNTLMSGGIFTGLFVGAMKLTAEKSEESEEEDEESAKEPDAEPAKADS
jgi:hypothetical protein